jgi:hypothetical protein
MPLSANSSFCFCSTPSLSPFGGGRTHQDVLEEMTHEDRHGETGYLGKGRSRNLRRARGRHCNHSDVGDTNF